MTTVSRTMKRSRNEYTLVRLNKNSRGLGFVNGHQIGSLSRNIKRDLIVF